MTVICVTVKCFTLGLMNQEYIRVALELNYEKYNTNDSSNLYYGIG